MSVTLGDANHRGGKSLLTLHAGYVWKSRKVIFCVVLIRATIAICGPIDCGPKLQAVAIIIAHHTNCGL